MKKIAIIIYISSLLSCTNVEFSSIYPANPPVDIEIISLTSGNLDPAYSSYEGDYLLLFRSENTKNARFGGFFIFIDPVRDRVIEMTTESEASYILGIAQTGDTASYNIGIDSQIAVLFSGTDATEIIVKNENDTYITYTITTRRDKTAGLIPGNWLAIRTYLYNSTTEEVIEDEVSSPGNAVVIP